MYACAPSFPHLPHPLFIVLWKHVGPCMAQCACFNHLCSGPMTKLECVHAPIHICMSTWLPASASPCLHSCIQTCMLYASVWPHMHVPVTPLVNSKVIPLRGDLQLEVDSSNRRSVLSSEVDTSDRSFHLLEVFFSFRLRWSQHLIASRIILKKCKYFFNHTRCMQHFHTFCCLL